MFATIFLWLYCTVLYCTVLYCTVLYCTVLYCTVLYYTVLYCTVLYCTVLCCAVLCCTVLYCTVLYCTVLYCTVLYCTVLHCTLLYLHLLYSLSICCGVNPVSSCTICRSSGCSCNDDLWLPILIWKYIIRLNTYFRKWYMRFFSTGTSNNFFHITEKMKNLDFIIWICRI